jgi:hypothetical protein
MPQRIDHRREKRTAAASMTSDAQSRFARVGVPDQDRPTKLIPWEDIWTSLRVARMRGNGEMIEVFYDALFKEAVFDDRGAWSWELKRNF